jgi:hypothetical protein
VLAPEVWKDKELAPFTEPVYSYTNAELAYEEADGDFKESPQKRAEIERKTKHVSAKDEYLKQFYTGQTDEDGNPINQTMSGLPMKEELLRDDLAVWFGTKKKPKGSKQPKGPWVNICRKDKDGKHPPCGRPEANSKGYPKCRAAGVAGKMTDAQKKSACAQKRRAEKKDPKIGKGNKPTMTRYNESIHVKEQVEKIEATEATGSGSTGGYESPAMWAKSTKKKDWGPSRKTQIPGGGFVKIKKKCTKFPYCNQGDINNVKISKNESVKEAIKQVASKMGISENTIITILEHEYEKMNKRNK